MRGRERVREKERASKGDFKDLPANSERVSLHEWLFSSLSEQSVKKTKGDTVQYASFLTLKLEWKRSGDSSCAGGAFGLSVK